MASCTSQVINSQRIKCSACGVSHSGSPSFVCIKHSSVHSTIYVPSISSLTDKLHHKSLHISLPHAFTLKLCTHYPAHPTIHHNLTNQQAVQLQTLHLQPLTTALAFLMLGTSSDSDTTYNWLHKQTLAQVRPSTLSAVFSSLCPVEAPISIIRATIITFHIIFPLGMTATTHAMLLARFCLSAAILVGGPIGTMTTYGICDSGN